MKRGRVGLNLRRVDGQLLPPDQPRGQALLYDRFEEAPENVQPVALPPTLFYPLHRLRHSTVRQRAQAEVSGCQGSIARRDAPCGPRRLSAVTGCRGESSAFLSAHTPSEAFTTVAEQPGSSVPSKAAMKNCWSGEPSNVSFEVLAAPGSAAMAL